MNFLLPHFRQHRGALTWTLLLATLQQTLQLVEPQIVRVILDRYVLRVETLPREVFLDGVLKLVALSIAVAFVWRLARTIQEYSIALIARRIGSAIYAESVAHSLLVPFGNHQDRRSGELLQKVDRARADAENGITGVVRLYLAGLAIAIVACYAATISWMLTAAIVLLVGSLVLFILLVSRPIAAEQRQIVAAMAMLSGSATEMLRNVEIVKSLGIEEQEIARLHEINSRILHLEQRKLRLIRLLSFGEGLTMSVSRAALLLTTVWLAYRRIATPGELVSIFFYSMSIFNPLLMIGPVAAKFHESRATLKALGAILDEPAEKKSADDGQFARIHTVELRNAGLTYPAAERAALHGIDVELRAGDTVAFVGPSGAGKSSLVKLLVGLYPPSEGTMLFNGIDSGAVNVDVIRRRIALVAQEPFLFAGTLRENLRLLAPDASDADCMDALERAAATSILTRGGRGLDSKIGEGGLKLSGGERQRIAIARALMRDPEVIIFDEATSNLDSLTEKTITATIRNLSDASRITVLIAHRLSTVAHAGRIYVLDSGTIKEAGTHDELLAHDGMYAAMWNEQSRREG